MKTSRLVWALTLGAIFIVAFTLSRSFWQRRERPLYQAEKAFRGPNPDGAKGKSLVAATALGLGMSGNLAETRSKAEKGEAAAQYQLGLACEFGRGLPTNLVEAAEWYREAAEQGFAEAQLRLGLCYEDGVGVAKSDLESVKWLRLAAENGCAAAQYSLSLNYEYGMGVETNHAEALKWLRRAAEQGNTSAQSDLARKFESGDGVTKDLKESLRWFRAAAESGDTFAGYWLGLEYEAGIDVPRDDAEAAKWYLLAARQGNDSAQFSAGEMYAEGRGVRQDFIEAYKWLNLEAAAETPTFDWNGGTNAEPIDFRPLVPPPPPGFSPVTGSNRSGEGRTREPPVAEPWDGARAFRESRAAARAKRDEVAQEMTAEQIAEAQRLARDFKPINAPEPGEPSNQSIAESGPAGSATGFFITDDGFLITNEHVIRDATRIRLKTATGLVLAKVVKADLATDLALLKADGRFVPLPITTSRSARPGNTVATIGFPNLALQGFAPKLAKGEIAALSGAGDDAKYFQISVPIQPGNSGGALVDARGNAVGVVAAKLNVLAALSSTGALPENVNYAVKSSFLLSFLESTPEVFAKLRPPNTKDGNFEDVMKSVEHSTALVLVY